MSNVNLTQDQINQAMAVLQAVQGGQAEQAPAVPAEQVEQVEQAPAQAVIPAGTADWSNPNEIAGLLVDAQNAIASSKKEKAMIYSRILQEKGAKSLVEVITTDAYNANAGLKKERGTFRNVAAAYHYASKEAKKLIIEMIGYVFSDDNSHTVRDLPSLLVANKLLTDDTISKAKKTGLVDKSAGRLSKPADTILTLQEDGDGNSELVVEKVVKKAKAFNLVEYSARLENRVVTAGYSSGVFATGNLSCDAGVMSDLVAERIALQDSARIGLVKLKAKADKAYQKAKKANDKLDKKHADYKKADVLKASVQEWLDWESEKERLIAVRVAWAETVVSDDDGMKTFLSESGLAINMPKNHDEADSEAVAEIKAELEALDGVKFIKSYAGEEETAKKTTAKKATKGGDKKAIKATA